MLTRSLFTIVTVALFSISPLLAQNPPETILVAPQPRTITVTGEAKVYVRPDEAVLTVGVTEESPDLQAAKKSADAKGKAILAAVRKAEIDEEDIQTDNLRVSMRIEEPEPGRRTRVFVVERGYQITLRDAARVQDVYDAVVAAGANMIYGPTYQASQLRKHRDQARQMALKAAQEKAAAMAGAYGKDIGAVRTIREIPEPEVYPMAANAMMQMQARAEMGGAGGEDAPLGQIAISARVEVIFDLQ